jgi:DNA-binding MarR family transcriptional regulator
MSSPPPIPRPPGTDNIGNLLRDPALYLEAEINAALDAAGFGDLRPPHLSLGQFVADEGSRITELAAIMQVTKPSVVYLVDELERLGYVTRRPDPTDARAKLVALTERALAARVVARRTIARVEREWSALLGADRVRELRQLLGDLREGLWPGG